MWLLCISVPASVGLKCMGSWFLLVWSCTPKLFSLVAVGVYIS